MPHVDEGTLHALLDGALRAHEPERADRVEAHLETCADCRARMEEAAALKDTAADILSALGGAAPEPDFDEVRARAAAGEAEERSGPATVRADFQEQVRWTRRLAWAATIVVALGAGYIARDLAGPTGAVTAPRTDRVEAAAPGTQAEDGPVGVDADAGSATEQADEVPSPSEPTRRARAGAADEEAAEDQAAEGQMVGERVQDQAGAGGADQPTGVQADQPAAAQADQPVDAGAVQDDAPEARLAEQQTDPTAGVVRPEIGPELEAVARQPLAFDRAVEATGTAADRVVDWVEVDLEEAERRLGGSVLLLPRARILEVLAAADGEPTVRSFQVLPGGVTVGVVQRPASAGSAVGDAAAGAADADAPVPVAGAPEARQLRADPVALENASAAKVTATVDSAGAGAIHTVIVHRADASLVLTGPLTPDMLTTLAVSARPPG